MKSSVLHRLFADADTHVFGVCVFFEHQGSAIALIAMNEQLKDNH